ncbi:preprotein translocase subunit YajC [Solitalea longa]|uniref:Sec translocon accessory complex subunit YajC n=1 Tax=Solitalea longa TaxID=2079460 RepID=A0A2S5A1X4_9SPHI|nr:preprotein translocase subunit YajC [Solitalea longa]POY36113.1 preprotein translocase subunit YajC [Solitalea longa]
MIASVLLQAGGGNMNSSIIMMVLIAVVFYFFMIRPQTKKMKDQKKFIEELKKGDKVVTIGGVHGKISEVGTDYFIVEIDHNVRIKIQKSGISLDNSKAVNTPEKEA